MLPYIRRLVTWLLVPAALGAATIGMFAFRIHTSYISYYSPFYRAPYLTMAVQRAFANAPPHEELMPVQVTPFLLCGLHAFLTCRGVILDARLADEPATARRMAEALRQPCRFLPDAVARRPLPYEGWWAAAWRQAGCDRPPIKAVMVRFRDTEGQINNYQILLRPEGWPLSGRGVTEYGLRPARLDPLIEAMR